MMGKTLQTVLIQHPGDPSSPLRINASDLKPGMVLWSDTPDPPEAPVETSVETAEPPPDPREQTATLVIDWRFVFSSGGWRSLKETAEAVGYEKPDDLTWEEAIPELEKLQKTWGDAIPFSKPEESV